MRKEIKSKEELLKKKERREIIIGCITILAIILCIILGSYFVTAGIVGLVCAAFGFTFTWLKATAIWFLLGLASSTFTITKTE